MSEAYTRACAGPCGDVLPLGQFRGGARTCKDCMSAKARRLRNTPAARRARRDARLRRLYGITLDTYNRLARAQRYRCAICDRKAYPAGSRLVPDHNHATGDVRALLCGPCNSALGLFGEKAERLLKAAEYLIQRGNYRDLHA